MENLLVALGTFVFVYLIYLFLVILRKKKIAKYKDSTEVKYLQSKYRLDLKKINMTTLAHLLSLTNAFIIAVTIFVTSLVENLILKLMVGFIVLFPMILIMYHLIGINLNKKYGKKW